jgi:hypothetical protein
VVAVNSRTKMVAVGVVAVLVVAGFVLWAVNRKAELARAKPAWLDPHQPPDGVAAELSTLTADQSWAANRCRPMVASCSDYTAGRRIRRIYDPCLEQSSGSFIRTRFELEGRC